VLASAGAHQHPMLQMAIARFLSSLRSAGVNGTLPRPQAVWLAVANLRNAGGPNVGWLRRFSGELRIDMLAPDGKLTGAPGAGLYVGPSIGANGVFGGQPGYGVPV
jgi:hypothetical protein